MTLLLFIAGLAALVVGAELLVRGASRLALSFGLSPLVIGLTIVAFGTSAPEVAVSVGAALSGQNDIALGNVVGSNIFNVLFILGVSALIVPLTVHQQVIRQEVPVMIGVSMLLVLLAQDGRIGFVDGTLLSVLLAAYTVFLVRQSQGASDAELHPRARPRTRIGPDIGPLVAQLAMIGVGLAGLVVGANWLVDAAVSMARAIGMSDVVVGLTIVAAGTSLPEVATSIVAAVKGERDIAVGNVVGSNTFNILGCLGWSSLAAGSGGLAVPDAVLRLDIWIMLAVAAACLPVFFTGREIARWEGALFLGYYAAYVAYLVLAAKAHASLSTYSAAMLGFVLPLTLVTLFVVLLRRPAPAAPPAPEAPPDTPGGSRVEDER